METNYGVLDFDFENRTVKMKLLNRQRDTESVNKPKVSSLFTFYSRSSLSFQGSFFHVSK